MPPRINIPPLTRGLLIGLLALTLLNAALEPPVSHPLVRTGFGAPYLTIVVGQSILYPWVFGTATLVEENVFGLLITGLVLFYGGRYLERAWSSNEFARFILFTAMIPNLLTFVLYWFAYVLSRNFKALTATIAGGISLQAAFLVAFKQLVPEHTVSIARGLIRVRVKHFPAIFLAANTISGLLLGTETAAFLSWFGFFTAWIYLRFFRLSPSILGSATSGESDLIRGDASDTFAFAHFFPAPVQPAIGLVADRIYDIFVSIRLCTPFSDSDIDVGNEQASARAEGGLPSLMNPSGGSGLGRTLSANGGRREEAERRRALALKALDQRLHAASSRGRAKPSPSGAGGAASEAGGSGAGASPAIVATPAGATGDAVTPSALGETNYEPDKHEEEAASAENKA